jgi:hypothetical protein
LRRDRDGSVETGESSSDYNDEGDLQRPGKEYIVESLCLITINSAAAAVLTVISLSTRFFFF